MTATSGTPAYVQVADALRSQIRAGRLGVGAQLPSMAQLRETYSVSNTVVRDALNELRREGLVIGQQGKGVFVRDPAEHVGSQDAIMGRLDELTESVRQLGERVSRLEAPPTVDDRS